jgi:hypothetical protein
LLHPTNESMTTKKTTSAHRQTRRTASVKSPSAYHRLDALLHTIRCIAQYEDALCGLSHELKRTGDLSPEISDELREILEKIPSHDYVLDLDAVRVILIEPQTPMKSGSRTSAKSVPVLKSPAVGKTKSGRKSSR